jgi:hypothetical protein
MADGTYMLTVEATSFKEMAKDAAEEWAFGTREAVDEVRNKFLASNNKDVLSAEFIKNLEDKKEEWNSEGYLTENDSSV